MKRFENGSRVCFIGDSLVSMNHALPWVIDCYRNNFPNEDIRFFNCGVAGGTAEFALKIFEEDVLRILRAVRFATILDFKLDNEVIEAIKDTRELLRSLSYNRKKEELDKIFGSNHAKQGVELLLGLGLDKYLELDNLSKVKCTSSLIGVWTVLDVMDKYPFSANERELITAVKEALNYNNLDPYTLYRFGLYANSVAGEINGYDIKNITESYNNLVIQSKKDLQINSQEIMDILGRGPGSYLKDIYGDIERQILYRRLENNKDRILEYIVSKY